MANVNARRVEEILTSGITAGHYVAGSNITITENQDGTETISSTGGGGGGGFTPTETQLAAINSGITEAKVTGYDALPDDEDVKDIVSDHFVAGSNITITDNVDGTQTIASTGGGGGFTPTETQLAAMNSGIDSTKVAQIETNKNNILYNTNQGVKNLFNNVATASSGNRVSYTPNADKSGTITTDSAGAAAPVYFDLGSVTLPSGSYILSGGVSADVSLRDSNNTYVDDGNEATITLSQSATISLRIRIATGYTNTNGVTVYPMIRKAIISDTTYQPYAMSNAELTAAILALQAQLANQ